MKTKNINDEKNTLSWDGKKHVKTPLVTMTLEIINHPFVLRNHSSDIPTFKQVFIKKEYDFNVTKPPEVLVDAGANIGLASIYFSSKYPNAKIIAIEPEESNFQLLQKNVALYDNIIPIQAALWNENGKINLVDPGLGNWGFMTDNKNNTENSLGSQCHEVISITIDRIIDDYGLDKIDILKIDIEGAEKEVFSDSSAWIWKVNSLIIELHERMKKGCNRSFYNGSNGFDSEWKQGENIYLSKNKYLNPVRKIISFMSDIKFLLEADSLAFSFLKKTWIYKNETLVFDFGIKKYNLSFDLSYVSNSQCILEIIDRDQQLLLKYNNIQYDFKKDGRYEILRLDNNVLINKISLITNLITSYVNAVAKSQ